MADIKARASAANIELRETEAAFDGVRAAMINRLIGLPVTATDQMQALVCGVQSLDAVKAALLAVVDSGKIEDAAEAVRERFGSGKT